MKYYFTYSLNDDTSDTVWVSVGSRSSILEVSLTLNSASTVYTTGGTTIGNTPGELVVGSRLMKTSHARFIALAIDLHVFLMSGGELFHSSFDILHSTLRTHLFGRDIGVKTSTIPVSWNWLRSEGDLGTEFFGNTVEEEARHPEVVAKFDAKARPNLVLPLGGHHLGVGAGDQDASVQASLVVSLDDVTAHDFAGSDTAVVWTLWTGESTCGPSVRSVEGIEECVFLFEAETRIVFLVLLHQLVAFGAVVEFVGGAVGIVAF
jgi:hypothetical protein